MKRPTIFPIPEGFEDKINPERSQSVSCDGNCCDKCVDIHPLADGENVLLVADGGQNMVLTIADFRALQGIDL